MLLEDACLSHEPASVMPGVFFLAFVLLALVIERSHLTSACVLKYSHSPVIYAAKWTYIAQLQ